MANWKNSSPFYISVYFGQQMLGSSRRRRFIGSRWLLVREKSDLKSLDNFWYILKLFLSDTVENRTKIGRYGPVWAYLPKFRYFSKIKKSWAIFGIWWNFEPVLANFICYLAHFNCFKWPNIKKPFCHLVTLVWTAGMVQVSNFGFVDFLLPYLTFSFFFVLGSRLVIKMMNHKAWIKKVFSDNRWRF